MLAKGEDPKPLLLEECKPKCTHWADKLSRCEKQLEIVAKINPTKTCIYPFRDWVTCVEACVSFSNILTFFRPNHSSTIT